MLRRSISTVALMAALALAGCGDDGDDAADAGTTTAATTTTTTTVDAAGDVARYCALTRELDAEGEKFFAGLGEDASPQEFQAAERRFIERHADDLDALAHAAPRELKSDVQKLFAGMRERAGLNPGMEVSETQASAAETRIRAFERRRCRA